MTGTITRVILDKGFGFIEAAGQSRDVFFHRNSLVGGIEFDATLIERRVEFNLIGTEKGPAAYNVGPVD